MAEEQLEITNLYINDIHYDPSQTNTLFLNAFNDNSNLFEQLNNNPADEPKIDIPPIESNNEIIKEEITENSTNEIIINEKSDEPKIDEQNNVLSDEPNNEIIKDEITEKSDEHKIDVSSIDTINEIVEVVNEEVIRGQTTTPEIPCVLYSTPPFHFFIFF